MASPSGPTGASAESTPHPPSVISVAPRDQQMRHDPSKLAEAEWWTVSAEVKTSFSMEGQVILHNLDVLCKEILDLRKLVNAAINVRNARDLSRAQGQAKRSASDEVVTPAMRNKENRLQHESERLVQECGNMLFDGLRKFIAMDVRNNRTYTKKMAMAGPTALKFKAELLRSDVFVGDLDPEEPASQIKDHLDKLEDDDLTDFYLSLCKAYLADQEAKKNAAQAATVVTSANQTPTTGSKRSASGNASGTVASSNKRSRTSTGSTGSNN